MGNVSQVVPSINPTFDIGTRAPHYSVAFQEAAGSHTAHGKVGLDRTPSYNSGRDGTTFTASDLHLTLWAQQRNTFGFE